MAEHVLVKEFLKNHSLVESNITSFNNFIEKRILGEYSKKNPNQIFNKYLPQLMSALSLEKNEDEKSIIFENRLLSELKEVLEITKVLQ